MNPKKERLGRGLGALIGDYLAPEPAAAAPGDVRTVAVQSIAPNPQQPRKEFADNELAELTESIREHGLLQPLVVRPTGSGRYELVAGERRFRSIQRLGWKEVPVVVREVDDDALLVLALVENLQREELNPMEEAEGYRVLAERFAFTQEEIAHAVGKERSTVANLLRLLKLAPSIRRMVEAGELSMGHARALLSVEDPVRAADLARAAVKEGWSVREVERRLRAPAPKPARSTAPGHARDPVTHALEEALRERLSTRVLIRPGKKGTGVIEVPFHGSEDFERVFALLAGCEAAEIVG
ncbi:MAG: ParB/RepB/Spo0J family partition protein [Gemmatimonadetes bacterium]|nr:ParB/RepB/Spo0J family partition protein [Gemmatimonadota bacterium]